MKRNSWFKFEPGAWLLDQELQSCSLEVIGALIQIMCILHQSREYGVLILENGDDPIKFLAQKLQIRKDKCKKVIQILQIKKLICKNSDGNWMNKRMVYDHKITQIRQLSGRMGASKAWINRQVGEIEADFAKANVDSKTGNFASAKGLARNKKQEVRNKKQEKHTARFSNNDHLKKSVSVKKWDPEDMITAKYFYAEKFKGLPQEELRMRMEKFDFGTWANDCRMIRQKHEKMFKRGDNYPDYLCELFVFVFQDDFESTVCLAPSHLKKPKNYDRIESKFLSGKKEKLSWQEREIQAFKNG